LLRFKRSLLALAVAQVACTSAFAADEARRIEELEKTLANSMALIEQLSQRLNQIEAGKPAPAPATTARAAEDAAGEAARIERLEQTVQNMSDNASRKSGLGTPLHGFADVGWARGIPGPFGRKTGYTLGNLDLYMTPEFGDRVRSIIELVFEYGPDGGGVATDLERLQFGYTFSDAATLWVGRFHTPYGYWNAAFHHGQQIQTAASRPRFIEFEDRGGILPAHAVGLLASGGIRAGGGRLQYDAYVANGNRIEDRVLDLNPYGDDNSNRLVGGNLRYSFGGGLEGLTLGLHAFGEKVANYDASNVVLSRTQVNMFGGLAVFDNDKWELIGEYYRFHNKDLLNGTGSHSSWAGFAQAGYRFGGRWTPYYRWERASLDQSDDYFAAQDSGRSYSSNVLGVRYELNADTAIKFEFNRTHDNPVTGPAVRSNGARFQFAVRF
jgi:hypothetical protein